MSNNKHLIVLSGPTAVGKTSVSIHLSNVLDAPILSSDSRQFYKEMSIGTAKPTKAQLSKAPHHFIDIRSVMDPLNAGDYEDLALAELEKIFQEKKVCILTGGSGLFLKAVYQGLDHFPEVPSEIRNELENEFKTKGIESLQVELEKTDPAYYQFVDLHNPRRVIRALEVIRASGNPYSSYLNQGSKTRPFKTHFVLLNRARQELYERINLRVDKMVQDGLEDEVKKLVQYRDLKSLQTVGYQEFFQYFDGAIEYEETIELIKRNSRRYAKRQMTWFRGQGDWTEFHPDDLNKIVRFIQDKIN